MSAETTRAQVEVLRDLLEAVLRDAVSDDAPRTQRERWATQIASTNRDLGALLVSRPEREDHLDRVVTAEEAVGALATALEADPREAIRRLGERVRVAHEAMRRLRAVAAAEAPLRPEPAPPSTHEVPRLGTSHRVPRLHPIPSAAVPGLQTRQRAPITSAEEVRRLIASLQATLHEVAGRVGTDGEAAFDALDSVVARVAPSPPRREENAAPAGLVPLRRRLDEDTRGPEGRRRQLLRHARGCFEELGTAGLLRRRTGRALVPRQVLRFEDRLLTAIDALAALATDGETTVDVVDELMRWSADGPATEVFRPFAQTLLLGCIDGPEPAELAVAALRTADPDNYAVRVEALILGVNPALDRALARALVDAPATVLPSLLDALTARRAVPEVRLPPLLWRGDPAVRGAAARALGTCRPGSTAQELLERLLLSEIEDSVVAAALESLARLSRRNARLELRRRLDEDDGDLSHRGRADLLALLSLVGDAEDVPRIMEILRQYPRDAGVVGAHGAVPLIPVLIELLERHEGLVRHEAARSLHRITGVVARPSEDRRDESPHRVEPDPTFWRGWWAAHESRFDPDLRYRRGEPWSCAAVVDELLALGMPADLRRLHLLEVELATDALLPDARSWTTALHDRLEVLRDELPATAAGGWLR